MLTMLLIRHASCDHVGRRLAGRAPGIRLNDRGRQEADVLGAALAHAGGPLRATSRIEALFSGPLERARETAQVLGRHLGLPVQPAPGLDELDFGEWTGRSFEELEGDRRWRAFNTARAETRIPGGERMGEAVARAVAELSTMAAGHPQGTVAAVSHADVIRGVLLRALGVSLKDIHRLAVVEPASVSVLRLQADGPGEVTCVNWTPGGPAR
jgi:broad specificity phosphatase PhoE